MIRTVQRFIITVYTWHHILNTAFGAFVFGMPAALLIPRALDPKRRIPHAIGTFFWGKLAFALSMFWRLEIEGGERLQEGGPYLVCANHQSLLDVLVLMALGGDYKWVSGARFFQIPLFAQYMRAAGYVEVDIKNPFAAGAILTECGKWIDEGVSVGMFPEGTRSRTGNLGHFKPGAFRVAVEKNVAVLPVTIDGTRQVLPRHGWTYLGDSPFKTLRIHVGQPIHPDELDEPSAATLSRATQQAIGEVLDRWRSAEG